jgi:DNA-binding response OmpR family regulator
VVEDDALLRRLLATVLEREGYQVTDVGTVALAVAQPGPWDLLLLDRRLSNGDGRRVAEEFQGTPTLYVSAYPDPEAAAAGNYLQKPFLPEHFIKKVRSMLPPAREELP